MSRRRYLWLLVTLAMLALPAAAWGHGGPGMFHEAKGEKIHLRTKKGELRLPHHVLARKMGKARRVSAAMSTPAFQVTNDVGGFETRMVWKDVAYAVSTADRSSLYQSTDKGRTWTFLHKFATRAWNVNYLEPNVLLVAENGGPGQIIWWSVDGGVSWTPSRFEDPANRGSYLNSLPGGVYQGQPFQYQTLVGDSFTQLPTGGSCGMGVMGTYNGSPALSNVNFIYASRDCGKTWQIIQSDGIHRHVHGVGSIGNTLYIYYGDDWGKDGVWVSTDLGASFKPACTGQVDSKCIVIDAALSSQWARWGTDDAWGYNRLVQMNRATGQATVLVSNIPYPSYSAQQLDDGGSLVATSSEGIGSFKFGDRFRRMYYIAPDGTVTDVFDYEIFSITYPEMMEVIGQYSDGTVVVYVSSHGTVFGKMVTGSAPPPPPTIVPPTNTLPPTVTGEAKEGQTLTADDGLWSGNPPPSISRQWQVCSNGTCSSITGATDAVYTLTGNETGKTVRIHVTATNSAGSTSADSVATAVVQGSTIPVDGSSPVDCSVSCTEVAGMLVKITSRTDWRDDLSDMLVYQSDGTGHRLYPTQVLAATLRSFDGKTVTVIGTIANPVKTFPINVISITLAEPGSTGGDPGSSEGSGGGQTPPPASGNLIANSDVEGGSFGYYFVADGGGESWATDAASSGSHSLKVTSSGGRWMTETTLIRVTPGASYNVSAWLKGQGHLAVTFWTGGVAYQGTTLDGPSATSAGGSVSYSVTAPPNAAYMRVEFRASGTLWADDLSVTS